MEPTGAERTGVFVARVWIDEGADHPLRARITHSVDLEDDESVVITTAQPEEVYRALRSWLEAFLVHCLPTLAICGVVTAP